MYRFTMTLTLGDVRFVRSLLFDICCKWYDIGVELEIAVAELDVIKMRCSGDPQDCLLEMIKLWLKSGEASLTTLADALRSKAVNEAVLAETVMHSEPPKNIPPQPPQEENIV